MPKLPSTSLKSDLDGSRWSAARWRPTTRKFWELKLTMQDWVVVSVRTRGRSPTPYAPRVTWDQCWFPKLPGKVSDRLSSRSSPSWTKRTAQARVLKGAMGEPGLVSEPVELET